MKTQNILVSPSILSADHANIQTEIEKINTCGADWIHVDIMDGVFVPNMSFGLPIVKAVKKHAKLPLDVHLMMVNPQNYAQRYIDAGADILTIHYEAENHLHRAVWQIKNAGVKAGVALNPATPISLLEEIIQDLDLVLIMTVNPGFGGQKFIENSYSKIMRCKDLILKRNSSALIEVDGGVDNLNAKQLADAGVDVLVAGSYVFGAKDYAENVKLLKVK
ncbi:MAG: ribulose-phosphate 3-epimerase [Bacteroidales bacterium]|nr:ribulose-phosphate 3-epimerase [Bacteroidales bacterium]